MNDELTDYEKALADAIADIAIAMAAAKGVDAFKAVNITPLQAEQKEIYRMSGVCRDGVGGLVDYGGG